jgi:hypothetical protein
MPPLSPTAIGPDLQTQVGLDGLWANLELMAATTEEPLPLGGRVSTVIVSRLSLPGELATAAREGPTIAARASRDVPSNTEGWGEGAQNCLVHRPRIA